MVRRFYMNVFAGHRWQADRTFALIIIGVLVVIGLSILSFVVEAVCTFIRNCPMPMW